MKRCVLLIFTCLIALAFSAGAWSDDRFAYKVVGYSDLGASPYDDPNAALGKPSTWVYDSWYTPHEFAASMIYSAWNTAPDGSKLVTTIQSGGYLTVEFDLPIYDDPANWYGKDFIVFGNARFNTADGTVYSDSNMEVYRISTGAINGESLTVSVSQDGANWYTYPSPVADNYWPTNAFAWNRYTDTWGNELDWTKPVNPSLTSSSLANLPVADAIDRYEGSAGGTAYDLAESGFSWIKYIKVTGSGAEVDGFSRVGANPALAAGGLAGCVELEAFAMGSSPVAVRVELIQDGAVVNAKNVVLDTSGNYSLPNIASGIYDVAFKASSSLRKIVRNVSIPTSSMGVCNVSLTNGDVDGDNVLSIGDAGITLWNENMEGD